MTKDDKFLEIISGLETKIDFDKYKNSIFFFKEGKYFFELQFTDEFSFKNFLVQIRFGQNENEIEICKLNGNNSLFWCSYERTWRLFYDEFDMNYQTTTVFIKDMIEKHFAFDLMGKKYKIKSLKPTPYTSNEIYTIEEHFETKN